jgi:predicted TIM-barrel fold metal-dependent hydrolase
MRYYSCDSHVVEPASVFEGFEDAFGSRAPRIDRVPGRGEFLVLPKAGRIPVGRLGIAGHRLDDPATDALIARGYAGLNPGVLDPHARLDEQHVDGIVGEVMYPSLNMFSFAGLDVDVATAVFAKHNDYIVDYCSPAPERLVGIGCLPIPDVDAAVAELERAAGRGVRGFMLPTHVDPARPWCHPDYDRFWAAVQDAKAPLTMHIFTGTDWMTGLPEHWGAPGTSIKGYTLAHTSACNTLIDLICGGVFERFPGVRVVIAEFETGWVSHFLRRLDHALYRTPHLAADGLTMKPSEYFRRNVTITFEDDLDGILTRDGIGVDSLAWGNDYPHHDSIWPHSRAVLDKTMASCTPEELERICFGNAVALYGIDTTALPAG